MTMRSGAIALIIAITCLSAPKGGYAAELEIDYQQRLCAGLLINRHLKNGTGIILVCRSDDNPSLCLKHRYLIEQTMSYWRVGMTLWLCDSESAALADCTREEICGPSDDSICDTVP